MRAILSVITALAFFVGAPTAADPGAPRGLHMKLSRTLDPFGGSDVLELSCTGDDCEVVRHRETLVLARGKLKLREASLLVRPLHDRVLTGFVPPKDAYPLLQWEARVQSKRARGAIYSSEMGDAAGNESLKRIDTVLAVEQALYGYLTAVPPHSRD